MGRESQPLCKRNVLEFGALEHFEEAHRRSARVLEAWAAGLPSHPRCNGCSAAEVAAMLKWGHLFVSDSAAVVSALWATFLFFAAEQFDVSPDGTPPTWEADGFMAVGCICAFAALLSAMIPG